MYDTVDKADLRAQRECVANSAIAAIRIANYDDWPAKHRSQEEIDELVRRMGYGGTVALGGQMRDYLMERIKELRPETKVWLERMKASWDEI
jgi:hypothetical protein